MPVLFQLSPTLGGFLVGLALALPLIMGVLALVPRMGTIMFRIAPMAAIPALMLSLADPVSVRWSGLMLGATFVVEGEYAVWLFFTSVLWFCSAWFGNYYLAHDEKHPRYTFFFLWAMAGNFGLILSRDPASFYASFAMMSILSYGLVVHDGKKASRFAGRVYLSMAVTGEVMQFAAISILFFPLIGNATPVNFQLLETAAAPSAPATGLFLAGFGIKAGLLGLHMWLPMAHPVAPTPASAVLSGSMIKAGLIGWISFLPFGRMAMPELSDVLILLGLSGVFIAAFFGVLQSNPKAVLAYSSVSQMGIITTGIGVGLGTPAIWPVLKWVIVLYAAHHAFAKCLLFLSVGIKSTRPLEGWERVLFWGGTIFAGLSLMGGPFSSGAFAKGILKHVIDGSAKVDASSIIWLLTLGAAGTTALMVRYVAMLRTIKHDHHHRTARWIWIPWAILLVHVVFFGRDLAFRLYVDGIMPELIIPHAIKGSWPIAVGLLVYGGIFMLWRLMRLKAISIPPGDIVHLFLSAVNMIGKRSKKIARGISGFHAHSSSRVSERIRRRIQCGREFCHNLEDELAFWSIGTLFILMAGALIFWLSFV